MQVLANGITGIQRGLATTRSAATEIAQTPIQEKSVDASALTDLKQGTTQVQANAKSITAADATIGSLLDIMA